MKRARTENKVKPSIGSYKVEQRQITFQGRTFHFVSYEGQSGAPAWFLMSAGTRWEVVAQISGEDPAEIDQRLLEWLKQNIK